MFLQDSTVLMSWVGGLGGDGTCKQHAPSKHLSQYAACGPHVYGLGIVVGGQEQTGGTIPLCYQTLGQIALQKGVKR